jgi:hypothetical protein
MVAEDHDGRATTVQVQSLIGSEGTKQGSEFHKGHTSRVGWLTPVHDDKPQSTRLRRISDRRPRMARRRTDAQLLASDTLAEQEGESSDSLRTAVSPFPWYGPTYL